MIRPRCAGGRPSKTKRAQGKPGVLRTRSLVCSKKSTRVSHHRFAETIRPSLRDGLRLMNALSPVSMTLLVTVACEIITRRLSTSPGVPGPHAFAVRIRIARLTVRPRPSHPRLTFRDDAHTPLLPRRDGADHQSDLGFRSTRFRKSELRQTGTTGNLRMRCMRRFRLACRANQ
jgi:hypothetical protein